ncbi:MAG: phosphate-starvation-inducible PsiE family protein [Hydrogenophilaceae bacterium]|nr:phosphate-starvation-inducible PsiE family protein [Hydrogenophilaceae bacterium]
MKMAINFIKRMNQSALHLLEHVGLGIIAIATVVAAYGEVMVMISAGAVTLPDLLLMFLYLEVLAMVAIYYEQGKLPIRFPIYIGMIALARYLIIDMKNIGEIRMLVVSGAILILAISVLIIRYGHARFPYREDIGNE